MAGVAVSSLKRQKRSIHGFSLIELMIVTVMLAILLTLAVPSYREFAMRSHRTVAITRLMQVASCQERIRAEAAFYNTGVCLPTSDQHYRYRYELPGQTGTSVFSALAIPVNTQLKDVCGTLQLNQDGYREIGNKKANAGKCWAGK